MTKPMTKDDLLAVAQKFAEPVSVPVPPASPSALKITAEKVAGVVLPPFSVLAVFMLIWQIAASRPGSGLPPPTQVYADSSKLILHPFFDNGGTDKGLGFHILASLSRVAVGYSIAAIVGVALGTLVGSSKFFMRGFDPIFQVLRTVPPLAWLPISLAAFRDAQPSAIFVIFITAVWPVVINTAAGIRNIPQDYSTLYFHRFAHWHRPFVACYCRC
jgi:nitrate/nitrite transport system permease protein